MALIKCPECGSQVSDKASACIHCGYPIQEKSSNEFTYSTSKKVIIPSMIDNSPQKVPAIKVVREVLNLGLADAKSFVEQPTPYITVKDGLSQDQADAIASTFHAEGVTAMIYDSATPINEVTHHKNKDTLCCPVCGSTQIQVAKKGFGLGKAAVGGLLIGPVGLLGGAIGSNKIQRICISCKHSF